MRDTEEEVRRWERRAERYEEVVNEGLKGYGVTVDLIPPKAVGNFTIYLGRYGKLNWYELQPYRGMQFDEQKFTPAALDRESVIAMEFPRRTAIRRSPLVLKWKISEYLDEEEVGRILPREAYYTWCRKNREWMIEYVTKSLLLKDEQQALLMFKDDPHEVIHTWYYGSPAPTSGRMTTSRDEYYFEILVGMNLLGGGKGSYYANGDTILAIECLEKSQITKQTSHLR